MKLVTAATTKAITTPFRPPKYAPIAIRPMVRVVNNNAVLKVFIEGALLIPEPPSTILSRTAYTDAGYPNLALRYGRVPHSSLVLA
jgi:hypothetical protein